MIINTTGGAGGNNVDFLSVVNGKVCITYDNSTVSSASPKSKSKDIDEDMIVSSYNK